MGLFLLDAAVVIRYLGITLHSSGHNLTQDFSRLFQKSGQRHIESIIAAFVPSGFFLAEFLASLKRTGSRLQAPGRLGRVGDLWVIALHRVPPAGFGGGVFRVDGSGDECGGWGGVEGYLSAGVRKMVREGLVRRR